MALRTFLVAFFVALLVLTCPSLAQDDTVDYDPRLDPPSSEDRANVLVLTDETFDATVNTHYNVFVKFYVRYHPFCSSIHPRLCSRRVSVGFSSSARSPTSPFPSFYRFYFIIRSLTVSFPLAP